MEAEETNRKVNAPLRVLIVEDSAVVAQFLTHVLGSDPGLEVIGVEPDGLAAIEAVRRDRPDVITMDIHMPRMSGLEATSRIMTENPVPIVMVSGTVKDEVQTTFHCLEVGALAFVPRPEGIGSPRHVESTAQLISTVKLMAEVKVVKRTGRRRVQTPAQTKEPTPYLEYAPTSGKVIAIGASAGGPQCLQKLLGELPADFSLPIMLVQHMVPDFVPGFASWLDSSCKLTVKVAEDGESLKPGHAYVAPGDRHLGVDGRERLRISEAPAENGHRPSVSYMFRSVVQAFKRDVIGVLLTGMGMDGAEELLCMREAGALTIAQDRESALVFGMPGAAMRLNAVRHLLPPEKIGVLLTKISAATSRRGNGI
ncbi:MAG: chemotaxis response regulator protein-glutamate methylesterase [Gammaproteobacteria bacterium]|nr:chemotaxis response regulator protein-glutamate methylesterase [Gammaproteobacteria bacterium]